MLAMLLFTPSPVFAGSRSIGTILPHLPSLRQHFADKGFVILPTRTLPQIRTIQALTQFYQKTPRKELPNKLKSMSIPDDSIYDFDNVQVDFIVEAHPKTIFFKGDYTSPLAIPVRRLNRILHSVVNELLPPQEERVVVEMSSLRYSGPELLAPKTGFHFDPKSVYIRTSTNFRGDGTLVDDGHIEKPEEGDTLVFTGKGRQEAQPGAKATFHATPPYREHRVVLFTTFLPASKLLDP